MHIVSLESQMNDLLSKFEALEEQQGAMAAAEDIAARAAEAAMVKAKEAEEERARAIAAETAAREAERAAAEAEAAAEDAASTIAGMSLAGRPARPTRCACARCARVGARASGRAGVRMYACSCGARIRVVAGE